MGVLIDTNVLSELRKGARCDPHVREWYAGVSESDIYVSVIVLGEIRRGAELLRRRDPVAAASLSAWLLALRESLADRLLPVTDEIADRWGQLGVPDALPVADGLLAATALVHDLVLVTRNTRDVQRSGARLLDPFGFTEWRHRFLASALIRRTVSASVVFRAPAFLPAARETRR